MRDIIACCKLIAYVQSLSAERSHGDRIGRTLPPLQLNGTLRHDTIINFYLYTCVVACRSTYFHRNILCEICRKHSTSGNYVKNRIADPKRSFPDPKEVNNRRKYPLCEGWLRDGIASAIVTCWHWRNLTSTCFRVLWHWTRVQQVSSSLKLLLTVYAVTIRHHCSQYCWLMQHY